MELEVIRELAPKTERLTDGEMAKALGVDRRTLFKWRESDWYKESIEKIRREWRRKLEVLPFFHPLGIGLEIRKTLDDPKASHADRHKAIHMAATLLPTLEPPGLRQEEEDAPGAMIETFKRMVHIKAKEMVQRKKEEAERKGQEGAGAPDETKAEDESPKVAATPAPP